MGTGADLTEFTPGHFAVDVFLKPAPSEVNKIASANIRNSNDVVITSSSTIYVKAKTIILTLGLLGQQRFLFDIKTSDAAIIAYGVVARNGVTIGIEQSTNSTVYVTKSEDITQTWNHGDAAELWIRIDGVGTVSVRNFRIAYDDNPLPVVAVPSVNY
jgi:hypothetical protein